MAFFRPADGADASDHVPEPSAPAGTAEGEDQGQPRLPEPAPRGAPARFAAFGLAVDARPVPPGLHVVATPIGNLEDITLRALRTLAAADAVVAEDSRVTKTLLAHYGVTTPLLTYHEHNAERMRPHLLARLQAGAALALVSDAGTPLVSDPGFKLVEAALEAGLPVTAVPGPSAVLAALVLAGLPTDRFFFEGFLPSKAGPRAARLAELRAVPATLVLFETGPRLADSLAALATELGDRPATVARELTKLHETAYRGSLRELAARFASEPPPRGEIVVVVGPPSAEARLEPGVLDAALQEALATLGTKDAAAAVAARLSLPRREVYARALELAGRAGRPG